MDYRRSPQNQQTLNKSLSLFQSGRPDKAEKLARTVLAMEPRNADLLQFVATLCQSQEKFADAVALCAKAVAIAPNAAGAHYNLGTALMKQGQLRPLKLAPRVLRFRSGDVKAWLMKQAEAATAA